MSSLGGLFRRKSPPRETAVRVTLSEGTAQLPVVGESFHQDSIEVLAGGRQEEGADVEIVAILVPEPENPHDPNAVVVQAGGQTVGHLSRHNAALFQGPILASMKLHGCPVACRGRILGGWDRGDGDRGSFGVMLYVDPSDFGLSFSDIQQEAPYARVDAAHSGAKRVRRSMSEDVGFVDGRHFTTYVDDVKTLRRYGADEQAEQLLLRLIDASEQEAHAKGWGVAPWYYEQLAIIYHKRRDHMDEIAILERFAQKPHAPGADPPKLLARLEKTRAEHPVA